MQQTVTVTDIEHSQFVGTAAFAVKPAPVTSYLVTGPTSVVAGNAFVINITAQDQYGNWNALYVPQAAAAANRPMCLAAIRMQSILHQLSSHLMTREN